MLHGGETDEVVVISPGELSDKDAQSNKTNKRVLPGNLLTRFLGPPAPPSLSAWEDVNRQCPVCQKKGFSSHGLALHVNECLDNRNASTNEEHVDAAKERCVGVQVDNQLHQSPEPKKRTARTSAQDVEIAVGSGHATETSIKPGRQGQPFRCDGSATLGQRAVPLCKAKPSGVSGLRVDTV